MNRSWKTDGRKLKMDGPRLVRKIKAEMLIKVCREYEADAAALSVGTSVKEMH